MFFPGLKLSCFALTLVLGLGITAPASAQKLARERTIRVTLLQLNDVYQPSPVDKGRSGGLARVATLRRKILAESPNTLFLLAGDTLSPSVASTIFKGEQMIAAWNAAGLDYATLGNHEFDFGPGVLCQRVKESRFRWLAANVTDQKNQPLCGVLPYDIREFGGVKVGLFGLLTADTATSSNPGPNVKISDPIEAARRVVKELRAKGATIIIAVTHLTMSQDKLLARSVPVDVIIGGHEHERLEALVGRTPIFKMDADARLLGRVELNISAATGTLESMDWTAIPVTDALPADPGTIDVISQYERRLSEMLDQPIAKTTVELDARIQNNTSRETNLGNLITDIFRNELKAEIAIIIGGFIRSNQVFPVGPLTRRDLISILPFENPVVKVEATGYVIRAALENSVSQVVEEPDPDIGRFLQVSGLRFSYDGRRAGSRVISVMVNDKPLEEKRSYTLATIAFLINGGEGYRMFRGVRVLTPEEAAEIDSAILTRVLSNQETIAPRVEGRIRRLDESRASMK